MREMALPDDLFARLQALAEPLVDTVPDVIRRLLDHYERTRPERNTPSSNGAAIASRPMVRERSVTGRVARERGATIEINGQQIQATTVRDMYEQTMRFIFDNGHAKQLKALVPFKTSGRRYLIAEEPVHPNGNNFVVPAGYNGFYMECHKDYRNAIKHLGQLTSKLGLNLRYLG